MQWPASAPNRAVQRSPDCERFTTIQAAHPGAPAQALFQLRDVCVKLFAETHATLQVGDNIDYLKHIALVPATFCDMLTHRAPIPAAAREQAAESSLSWV